MIFDLQPILLMRPKGSVINALTTLYLLCLALSTLRRLDNASVCYGVWQFDIFLVFISFLVLFIPIYIPKSSITRRQPATLRNLDSDHPLAPLLLDELLESTGQPALSEDDDRHCYICEETYLSGDSPEFPIALLCGHTVGSNCIMKWLSPLRNTGHNSCPQCRAKVFDEWTSKDFPPPPPVVPLGNGPAEREAQVNIASSALRNIQALLPPGGTADFDVEGVGHVRLGAVPTHGRFPVSRQMSHTTVDGRHRATSEAVRAASRRIDRPRPAEYRNGASDARARPEMRDYPALPEANSAGEASGATIAAANQRYRPERAPRVYGQAHESGEETGTSAPPRDARRGETRQDNTRSRSAKTRTARNVPRRPAAVTVNEVMPSNPEETNRPASRITTLDQAPTHILPAAAIPAGANISPPQFSTASATPTRLPTGNPSIFDTYLDYWASERRPRGEA